MVSSSFNLGIWYIFWPQFLKHDHRTTSRVSICQVEWGKAILSWETSLYAKSASFKYSWGFSAQTRYSMVFNVPLILSTEQFFLHLLVSVISPPIPILCKNKSYQIMGIQLSVDLCNEIQLQYCVFDWYHREWVSGQNKNHTSKIVCSNSYFYHLVRNMEVCSIQLLTRIAYVNVWVSQRCFLTSPQSCASIYIPVCSKRLQRLWTITKEQPNNFAMLCLGIAAILPKILHSIWCTHSISTVYFTDIICWFLMFWLK